MPGDRDGAAAAALAYLMDGAPVRVLSLDARAVVVEANAHARRVLGDDMVGRPFADLTVQFASAPHPQTTAFAAPGPRDRSGLTIAQKVVSAHRGRIWIESAPGQGAIFRVALPVNPVDEQA